MVSRLSTHTVSEIAAGVFYTILEPCSVAVLAHVLASGPTHVWVVDHWPDPRLQWTELPVPLTSDGRCELLPVRLVQYDFQLPADQFLASVLPRLPQDTGITLLQLDQPVGQSLEYRRVAALPNKFAILRQAGWRLTFKLPHGGEYAEVTAPTRAEIERILADPVVAAGKATGNLP